ncbi:MAG: PEP-CTERM sorting domain-containing protein [Phycisphaeraceae bacterium]|nr:PEP-CTERM sorting domain-containing protein [Phycisphaeraceae bacterium]
MQLKRLSILSIPLIVLAMGTAARAAVGDGLVGYWKLDEASGTAVSDASSIHADGTNNGADINQAGVIGTAYNFAEIEDDYVDIPTTVDVVTSVTISAWINPTTFRAGTGASSSSHIFGDLNSEMLFRHQTSTAGPGQLLFFYDSAAGNQNVLTPTVVLSTGVWQHVAATMNGVDIALYVNGIQVHSINTGLNADVKDSGGSYFIGRYDTNTARDFDGLIDDVGLWTSAKSAEEIALIAGLGKFVGMGLNVYSIDSVLATFNAASGSAGAGGYAWNYVTGLASTTIGETGGTVGGGDAWIALDASGNGVQIGAALHAGDANGDGLVNLSDLQILGDNWQSSGAIWDLADFSGDGTVNLSDLQILGDNWGFGVGPDISFDEALAQVGLAIPEPTSLMLLGLGGLALLRRRVDR